MLYKNRKEILYNRTRNNSVDFWIKIYFEGGFEIIKLYPSPPHSHIHHIENLSLSHSHCSVTLDFYFHECSTFCPISGPLLFLLSSYLFPCFPHPQITDPLYWGWKRTLRTLGWSWSLTLMSKRTMLVCEKCPCMKQELKSGYPLKYKTHSLKGLPWQ